MYTPRTSVEAIPNASIHHSALQNRDFGHTYDRSRALVRALVHDEVRILIFDDPAEQEDWQRPLREVNCQIRARATWAACMEKIYEIPRALAARGAMRWLRTGQVYSKSTTTKFST